jgi:N-acetylglucosamine-6-sulfatase
MLLRIAASLALMLSLAFAGTGAATGSVTGSAGAAAPSVSKAVEADRRLNYIVFFTDDMRRDDLRFTPKTQRLLGEHGTTFTRMYSNTPLCCPFRAIVLTGQLIHNNMVYSNRQDKHGGVNFLDTSNTIPAPLQKAGYKTAYIGKYLNGFDADNYAPHPGWNQWHVPVRGITSYNHTTIDHNGTFRKHNAYVTEVYERITNRTVRQFSRSDKPFYMAVSQLAPHFGGSAGKGLATPDDEYLRTVDPSRVHPVIGEADTSDKPSWVAKQPQLSDADKAHIAQAHRLAAESLKSVDDAVASLVRTLRKTGELDNTVLIFTSDNGYMRGEHNIPSGKIFPYEESANMPMLVRGPGFKAGAVRTDPVGSVDVAATVLEGAGVQLDYPIDGKPLGVVMPERQMMLEAGPRFGSGRNQLSYIGLVTEEWKYIRYYDDQVELYRMDGDRKELDNVYASHPEVTARLDAVLNEMRDCSGSDCIG